MHDTRSFQAALRFGRNALLRQEDPTLTKRKAWDLSQEKGSTENDDGSRTAGRLQLDTKLNNAVRSKPSHRRRRAAHGEERWGSPHNSKTQNASGRPAPLDGLYTSNAGWGESRRPPVGSARDTSKDEGLSFWSYQQQNNRTCCGGRFYGLEACSTTYY